MFCPFCGAKTADGASFCNNCGGRLSGGVQMHQYQEQKETSRQREIAVLKNMIRHFSVKQEQYDQCDKCGAQVNETYKSRGIALIVFGCILLAESLVLLPMYISLMEESIGGALLGMLSAMISAMIPGALMLFFGIKRKNNNAKTHRDAVARYESLSRELLGHYHAYPNCPVGPEYTNPRILVLVLQKLQSGRVDNLMDSLNRVMKDSHDIKQGWYIKDLKERTVGANIPVYYMSFDYFD